MDKIKWAEGLIRQLPETHDGRNSWLLNHGEGPDVEVMRDKHPTYRTAKIVAGPLSEDELPQTSPIEPTPTYTLLELRVILHDIREVVRAAWVLLDNSEDVDGRSVVDVKDFDCLAKAMDRMDEIAAMDTGTSGYGGHAVTMAMDMLARNNKDVRDTLVKELCDNICTLQTSERSREIGKAAFLAALVKYNKDHTGA